MNTKGNETSEFKITLLVILAVMALLALVLTGVVSMERLRAEVPAALVIVSGLVAGAYNISRGLAKLGGITSNVVAGEELLPEARALSPVYYGISTTMSDADSSSDSLAGGTSTTPASDEGNSDSIPPPAPPPVHEERDDPPPPAPPPASEVHDEVAGPQASSRRRWRRASDK